MSQTATKQLIAPQGPITTPLQHKMGLKSKMRQRVRRSARFLINRANQPPAPAKAHTKKKDFLEALKGTGGIKTLIAENLGVNRITINALLKRADWQDVNAAYLEEVEAGKDDAEECIRDAIKQRMDLSTASLNARWYLSRVRKQIYGDESKVTVEGGDNPIKVLAAHIPVQSLTLPLEVKRVLVEAMDAKEDADRAAEMDVALPADVDAVVEAQEPDNEAEDDGAGGV